MTWAWPAEPCFRGGNPHKAWRWKLQIVLHSGDNHDTLAVSTDGPVRLPELYEVVRQHVDEFRETVGPLTGASITGTGEKQPVGRRNDQNTFDTD